ncbi:ABC transporter ATP-binding protein [Lacticaseibacillus paracasei]|uniref:Putative hemin import ATP-binding protein HrtA n=1 Tax=Lacticaseibacillus paracasei TaxID=1597 RepID=A0A422M072_LACPA|nr:ABC transporter ATP-binding protein [Lacticaseibacillus paracasei]AKU33798.1 peptide ABC transporter ATP-binding protein [Lacticaseibacillus paracasei]EKQ24784.1 ATP-binding component of an ABC superfamily transporter [Lacticaseibacillus paracasei]MBM6414467.1 ABC transporter ATP-binding protein [Lacticaseibacillus paracasei]RDG21142.1 ABC transporter ATP-binding protein [Lacticaseibacillus paracasei]RHX74023.1 ABC transporter ATP-binding protein [Lacticaseibacillus paracasei]
MSAIELQHIIKNFKTPASDVEVLKDVSFSAEPGSLSLVLGPSGSGKSTFLTIAGGIQTPTSGVVTTAGQELDKLSGKARDALRLDKIGFVLQSYNLVPYLTVGEQFTLVDKIKPKNNLSHEELDQLLDDLGIGDLVNQYPASLSGGQTQRVAIARALYPDPAIVLADEPTAALDSPRVAVVGQLLADLAHKRDKAIVVVTHDVRLEKFADRTFTLLDGQLSEGDTSNAA